MFTLDIHQSNRINNMSREQLKAAIKSQGLSEVLFKRGFNFTASNEALRSVLMSDVNNSYRKATPKSIYHSYDSLITIDGYMSDVDIFDAITLERSKPFTPSPFVKHLLSGKSIFPKVSKYTKQALKKC